MTMQHLESEGGLSRFVEDPDPVKANLAKKLMADVQTWRKLYGDIALPPSQWELDQERRRFEIVKEREIRGQMREGHKSGSLTPEVVTAYWRSILPTHLTLPYCDWKVEEINRPMRTIDGRNIAGILVPDFYIPPGLTGFRPYLNDPHTANGYVKMEASVDAPNLNTSEEELKAFAREQGYQEGRLQTYTLASTAINNLTGGYINEDGSWLDQNCTWSRLLGIRYSTTDLHPSPHSVSLIGRTIAVQHDHRNGRLENDWISADRRVDVGCRFEEAKRD